MVAGRCQQETGVQEFRSSGVTEVKALWRKKRNETWNRTRTVRTEGGNPPIYSANPELLQLLNWLTHASKRQEFRSSGVTEVKALWRKKRNETWNRTRTVRTEGGNPPIYSATPELAYTCQQETGVQEFRSYRSKGTMAQEKKWNLESDKNRKN
jgi:hypothetical protein